MKTIIQRGENDCGVACVAMLADVSYEKARNAIYPKGREKLTKTKDLLIALTALGRKPLSYRRKPFGTKSPDDLDKDALMFAMLDNQEGSKHWVVWDSKKRKVREPYPNKLTYRLRGYLCVD